VAAAEDDRGRSLAEERVQADEVAGLVGQHERRHELAGAGRRAAGVGLAQPGDEPVNGVGERRSERADYARDEGEALVERGVHLPRLLEGGLKGGGELLRRPGRLHAIGRSSMRRSGAGGKGRRALGSMFSAYGRGAAGACRAAVLARRS
jgi:hypothetical protein